MKKNTYRIECTKGDSHGIYVLAWYFGLHPKAFKHEDETKCYVTIKASKIERWVFRTVILKAFRKYYQLD